jgi:hypothetical protein
MGSLQPSSTLLDSLHCTPMVKKPFKCKAGVGAGCVGQAVLCLLQQAKDIKDADWSQLLIALQ